MTEMKNELSKKEQAVLDRKIERLETKIVEVKHNYDELLSQYTELSELRHPEKKRERIKETLYSAYCKSNRSLDEILAFMAGDFDEDM